MNRAAQFVRRRLPLGARRVSSVQTSETDHRVLAGGSSIAACLQQVRTVLPTGSAGNAPPSPVAAPPPRRCGCGMWPAAR